MSVGDIRKTGSSRISLALDPGYAA